VVLVIIRALLAVEEELQVIAVLVILCQIEIQ